MADDMFAGLKKKSKKSSSSKKADLLQVDEGETPSGESRELPKGEDPVRPEEASADLTLNEEEPLDFSDLKKKKKKKNVALNLEDVETPETSSPAAGGTTTTVDALGNTKIVEPSANGEGQDGDAEGAPAVDAMAEFSGLKKKKRGKKTAFDLEAFEKELAAVEDSGTSTPVGGRADSPAGGAATGGAGSDDEGGEGADVPAPEGDNPFGEDGENTEGKSKAENAAEKKLWLQDPDRDYTYTELLGRFYSLLFASHPSLSRGGGKKRFTIAPPNISREGSKKSAFSNIGDICKKLHRQPEHVIQFLFAELGTSGSVDGSGRLVIKGRYQQKQIENVLRRYIVEYVTCKTCKSGDTLLTKDNRIFFVQCETCGSKTSVSSIKVGFQAQTKRRPKAA